MKKEMLINDLVKKGWAHQESFFPESFCLELLSEAQNSDWIKAKVGKGHLKQEMFDVRNDSIFWIDDSIASPLQKNYLSKMQDFMLELNRELYLGLKEFECHFARYEASGFYKKHLDQHQGSHQRVISTVLYLNGPISGGELALYNKDLPEKLDKKIQPIAGSFVCFLSNQIYHEVLSTKEERYSLTGWFRTST